MRYRSIPLMLRTAAYGLVLVMALAFAPMAEAGDGHMGSSGGARGVLSGGLSGGARGVLSGGARGVLSFPHFGAHFGSLPFHFQPGFKPGFMPRFSSTMVPAFGSSIVPPFGSTIVPPFGGTIVPPLVTGRMQPFNDGFRHRRPFPFSPFFPFAGGFIGNPWFGNPWMSLDPPPTQMAAAPNLPPPQPDFEPHIVSLKPHTAAPGDPASVVIMRPGQADEVVKFGETR